MSDDESDFPVVESFTFPARAHYQVTAGFTLSNALRALKEGRFVGQVSRVSGRVYMPPLGSCPISATPTTEDTDLPSTGVVIAFCIVNIPVHGQGIKLPFACADIMIDGADTTFLGLIQECDVNEVRIGMRVKAVFVPVERRTTSLASIQHFVPTGEPDTNIEALKRQRQHAWKENQRA